MAWMDSKNYRQFSDTEEPEEEENEDYNIDQIVNRLQSKLDSSSQNTQSIPNKLNTNQSFISKNITPPQKLIRTLMSNQIQLNNSKNIIVNNNNSKVNSSNNTNVNKTTEKDDEVDMSSVISRQSAPKNYEKRYSNSLSLNINLPSEVKDDIENKKNIQFIINNLKTYHHSDTDITNSQIDNSKFILNKHNDINEILQSKKFQKEDEIKKESKDLFKDKINELVDDKNKVDENLCKIGKRKKFKNLFINKRKNRFYKCIVVNCYCNYNLRNICKCCRNFNTITFIRNIFIFTVIVSAVSFYTFLIFFN